MKKRIFKWLVVALLVFLVAFAYFYSNTKGNVTESLEYSAIITGTFALIVILAPLDIAYARFTAKIYDTDLATGKVINKLQEQNRILEEQNRKLEEQNRNKR